jgi:hypothetical protein
MGMSSFAHGGCQRACAALEPNVRAEVAKEYVQRLAQATVWQRWQLDREMEREIKRRIRRRAPPGALY